MSQIPLISFDESGFTGPNLLHDDQPLFVYAAVDLSIEEAESLIAEIRHSRQQKIKTVELKASNLRKRRDWPEIADLVLHRIDGRYSFIVFDKRLALAGKAYEYLMEPVLERNSALFYGYGLHRVVAGAVYRSIKIHNGPAEEIAIQLERFMRSFDSSQAPGIFTAAEGVPEDARVLAELLRFSRGYAVRIEERSQHLKDDPNLGKWVLDLTSTALMSLLVRHFGPKYHQLEVLCDESKPLQGVKPFFDHFVGREDVFPLHGGNRIVEARLNLAEPLRFGRSHDNPTLQIADVIAGLAAQLYAPIPPAGIRPLKPLLERHLHEDHILPDTAADSQMSEEEKRINLVVLRHLAGRAELQADPLKGMEKVYAQVIKREMSVGGRLRKSAQIRR
ncbi:DUF3800 domain-containing protein [Glycocaulis profundi]|nr:DUF3800 domain-containing protein [Glycocaulis profundi]